MRYALILHNHKDLRRQRTDIVNQIEIHFCMIVPSMDISRNLNDMEEKCYFFCSPTMNKEKLLGVLLT